MTNMDKVKEYIIRKGCHYSNFFPKFYCTKDNFELNGNFMFTDSCKYEIDEASCVNKLFGFCFGFGVHKNSIRFGWTYNAQTNQIYIWKYFYIDGELEKEKIFECEIGEPHFYEIKVEKDNILPNRYFITLKIDDKTVFPNVGTYESMCIETNKCFITTLGPYFGGNTRAPHTMKIEYYGREKNIH